MSIAIEKLLKIQTGMCQNLERITRDINSFKDAIREHKENKEQISQEIIDIEDAIILLRKGSVENEITNQEKSNK